MREWWKDDTEAVDLAELERLYREETNDKPYCVGFERRFQEWCAANLSAASEAAQA